MVRRVPSHEFERAGDATRYLRADGKIGWKATSLFRCQVRSRGTPAALKDASAAMVPIVGKKVRFYDPYRPPQVRWGTVGVIVDVEERPSPIGHEAWVRARFGDF